MHSRARLLIERDLEKLQEQKPWGIAACPISNNFFEWTANILGQKKSVWAGGIFQLRIQFSEYYNHSPPVVTFHTIPFHPNVDPFTGEISLDILDERNKWIPDDHDLIYVLVSLQNLLSKPSLDNAINSDAVDMLRNYPARYEETARQCVTASQKLNEENSKQFSIPFELNKQSREISNLTLSCLSTSSPVRRKVAFEDYYTTWSEIGTSKSDDRRPTSVKSVPSVKKTDQWSPMVIYGTDPQQKSKTKLSFEPFAKQKKEKIEKINRMKQMYLHRTTPLNSAKLPNEFTIPGAENRPIDSDDLDEHDVDALISWTDKLDVDF